MIATARFRPRIQISKQPRPFSLCGLACLVRGTIHGRRLITLSDGSQAQRRKALIRDLTISLFPIRQPILSIPTLLSSIPNVPFRGLLRHIKAKTAPFHLQTLSLLLPFVLGRWPRRRPPRRRRCPNSPRSICWRTSRS